MYSLYCISNFFWNILECSLLCVQFDLINCLKLHHVVVYFQKKKKNSLVIDDEQSANSVAQTSDSDEMSGAEEILCVCEVMVGLVSITAVLLLFNSCNSPKMSIVSLPYPSYNLS